MTTPRCFIVRHGETEWSLSGQHTGSTDIPLTANGEKRMRATSKALVGDDRLIVPKQIKHMYACIHLPQPFALPLLVLKLLANTPASYVSPRHRAQRTLELLNLQCAAPVTVTDKIREWEYGDYEGITSQEIREKRTAAGLDPHWDIWTMGCPNGESPEDVIKRVDELIKEIREEHHSKYIGKKSEELGEEGCKGDVVVVAHGHILRAFAMRWVGESLSRTSLIMEAGGVGTLSYEHKRIEEPAILLGGGFVVGGEVLEDVEREEKEGKIK